MTDTSVNPVSVMPPPIAEKPALTIEVITVEIKFYLGQMTQNIIEVGKRLIMAKELVPHGEWKSWLEKNFNLKYRMAANFMAVASRFGNMSNSQEVQSIALLGTTQLISMLALPEGDEQQFVDQMAENGTPVDEMSVRELKAAVKQYKQDKDDADAAVAALKEEIQGWKDANQILEQQRDYQAERAENAVANYQKTDERNGRLLYEMADLKDDLDMANADIAKLQAQLEKGKTVTKEVPPADYEDLKREVKDLRERPVEVAVEKPSDYEPIKAELAELKAREDSFMNTSVSIRKLEALASALESVLNDTHIQDAVTYLAKEKPEFLNLLLTQLDCGNTEMKNYAANAQATDKPVETTAVAKPLTRAEIINELKKLAAADPANKTSAKMREFSREFGKDKSNDLSDEQLLSVLNKTKEWLNTNGN